MHDWRKLATAALVLGTLALGACSDTVQPNAANEGPQSVTVGGSDYDLNTPLNGSLIVNGAKWTWPVPFNVGTGQISPFLSVQANGIEQGFNSRVTSLDGKRYTNFTHELPLNHIPVISVGGTLYREIILDANEANSGIDALFAIRKFDLWMCDDSNAPNYDAVTDFSTNVNCDLVYDLNGNIARATDEVTSGSGLDLDYQILIPDANFETTGGELGADLSPCQYEGPLAAPCGVYLVLHAIIGAPTPFSPAAEANWVTGSTFEEFSTINRPWVTVSKTAVPSFTRTWNWTIDKSVTPASWQFLPGQNGTSNYSVTVTKTGSTDSNWAVSGVITITNPSDQATSISSIADTIKASGQPNIPVTVTGCTLPLALAAGASATCNYTATLPSGIARTNEVTVAMTGGGVHVASAPIDFSTATPTEVNGTIHVTDKFEDETTPTALGTTSSTHTYTFTRQYDCEDAGGYGTDTPPDWDNRAQITETGQYDDAAVTVVCGNVEVTKTAATSLTRTWQWSIDKSVTPATWALFKGDDGTSEYTVAVTKTGYTDSNWAVAGSIVVQNTSTFAVTIDGVADAVSGVGAASVTCPVTFPYALAAGASFTCSYTRALPDGSARTNTATASVSTLSFTGTAPVSFSAPTINTVNATVHITDTFKGALGTTTDNVQYTYSRKFTCNGDAGTHDNTATITETAQSDNASVTVSCYNLTVTKNANEELKRTWTWDLDKAVDASGFVPGTYDAATHTATIQDGEVLAVPFNITASAVPTDSDWKVSGSITVANPAPMAATLTGVTDVVSPAINASVTCPALTVPAAGNIVCTYTANLPDAAGRTNTATATQQNYSYNKTKTPTAIGTTSWTGTAAVDFAGAAITKIDECINLVDALSGNPGVISPAQLCENTNPKTATVTFTFNGDLGIPLECEANDFTNLVTGTTIDTGAVITATAPITIYVECEEGCTLTQGYWKTHNQSFLDLRGGMGPPVDERWSLIGDADLDGTAELEDEGFFLSGQTWFEVFVTAPQGNVYYNLAHQYMAAKLNVLSGAAASAVAAALADAAALFQAWTPAQIGELKGKPSDAALRNQFIELAGILGRFNEGLIGPGHCTENVSIVK